MLLVSQAELRLAEQTLQNTLANRSPVVSGTSTACDLVEELIRASRGLEVAAQAALTNEELVFIRATQREEMQAHLGAQSTGGPATTTVGIKRKRDDDDAAESDRSRSKGGKRARNASARARKARQDHA